MIQWGVTFAIDTLHPRGVRYWEALALEVLFAVATLSPVLIEIYRDVAIMLIRANRSIQAERERVRAEESGESEPPVPGDQPDNLRSPNAFWRRRG